MMKMKLDIALKFIKNRFRFSPTDLESDCRHKVHAINPDRRAAAKQAMLMAASIEGNPSQIGAVRGNW